MFVFEFKTTSRDNSNPDDFIRNNAFHFGIQQAVYEILVAKNYKKAQETYFCSLRTTYPYGCYFYEINQTHIMDMHHTITQKLLPKITKTMDIIKDHLGLDPFAINEIQR